MTLHSAEALVCPTTAKPSSLPAEILQLIAHHLQDNRRALYACLLVSRAWSQAAVEFLYKAEHLMTDYEFRSISTLAIPVLSLEGLALEDENHSSNGSRPKTSAAATTALSNKDLAGTSTAGASKNARYTRDDLPSEVVSLLLLRRTLDASLLHDASCSYDYLSYLNKISCPWFMDLIQDWGTFCNDWRGHCSRRDGLDLPQGIIETVPSPAREEHCFNRLVRKVSKRCLFVDEFRSSTLVQPETLVYAIRHFRNLTWIDLKDSQDLDDRVFEALASTVRSLAYIRLPGSRMENVSSQAVTDVILAQEKDSLCQFKIMHGSNIFEDDLILQAIGSRHGRSMKRLTLAICDLEHSGLQDHVPHCTQLVSLNLEYSSGVTNDVILPILDSCRQLSKLDLTETECTQMTIQGLSTASDSSSPTARRFEGLKRLILNNMDAPFTTNVFLPLADACPNLEELHMNSILADSFQDFSLFLAKTPKLMDLDIGNVFPEFTDANLSQLVDALPDLRWLSIANTQITNASLVYLAERALNLCDLCILGCDQVTKAGLLEFLDRIANKAGFRRLDITYCRLEEAAVADIRERAKLMAMELGIADVVDVEGDEQFADSLLQDEEGEREEEEEEEEEEDQEFDDNDSVSFDFEDLPIFEDHTSDQPLELSAAGAATPHAEFAPELVDSPEGVHSSDADNLNLDATQESEREELSDFSDAFSDSDDDAGTDDERL
ncbi:hypothetical protein KVV02_001887 [Mortierella alpina]|uniref:F-box domain-containing protein n=1 Tax=Mortierella alpina TaxID=64518 RepID=A0A9P8ACQ6_MORAP|nr:hypothetical protein KVV02_001887 [Mortierella alpina]